MKKTFSIIIISFLFSLVSLSQQPKGNLETSISSRCGNPIINPTVYNALKLISLSFSDFEILMKNNKYEYNSSEDSYWAKVGAGCNYSVINKKYDYITFFWTGDKNLINALYDELKLNKIKLFTKGSSQLATIKVEGMIYELSVQDLGEGSGGFTFQEKGEALTNDINPSKTKIGSESTNTSSSKEQSGSSKVTFKTYTPRYFSISLPPKLKLLPTYPDDRKSGDYCDYTVKTEDGFEIIELNSLLNTRFLCGVCDINDFYESALKNSKQNITYKTQKDNWFVISGIRKNGNKFYWKRVLGVMFISDLTIEYPDKYSAQIEPYISKITKSFTSQ